MTQYSGKVIRKTPVTPTQQSASGVWKLNEQAAAIRNNSWPVPGVPDPISRSVRLRSSASAYLTRTPSVAGNQKTWTWSAWVKRGSLSTGANQILFSSDSGTSNTTWLELGFDTNNLFYVTSYTADTVSTAAVFRDPSAWYHLVVQFDSTQATSANRCRIYVNNVQQTLTGAGFTLNANYGVNAAQAHDIGRRNWPSGVGMYTDGYLTEINFIDGQALTPSSFGTTDTASGAWIPMPYTGTYGTNGFYLNFKDNTSTTTLGLDYSGNGNNWTANNVSLTAGVTYDSMLDVPTPWVGYSTTTDTSAVTRGNYAVMNPLDVSPTEGNGRAVFSNGNLTLVGGNQFARGWQIPSSGQWYWEITLIDPYVGPPNIWGGHGISSGLYTNLTGVSLWADSTGGIVQDGTKVQTFSTWANNDVIGFAYDAATRSMSVYRNGTQLGTSVTANATDKYVYSYLNGTADTSSVAYNFGQRPFTYSPPSGYKALCTTNLPTPTITNGANYMAASTWTGTSATQSIVNSGNNTAALTFKPDFVWIKQRSGTAQNHYLVDSVRGNTLELASNSTAAEVSASNALTSFNSNGFSLGNNSDGYNVNASTQTYIGWQWQAGQGSTSSNTSGSITSTVSVNTTAGFSVVTWAGTSTNASTIGHGLGVAPSMIITKSRTNPASWVVGIGGISGFGVNDYLTLQTTNAKASSSTFYQAYGASTFTVGVSAADEMNKTGNNYVSYCWAAVPGYSAFGSYTGNGSSDGAFIYCGFRPRFILHKASSTTSQWMMWDTSRNTYNVLTNAELLANSSAAEGNGAWGTELDILSNGFKFRGSDNSNFNYTGVTYIYAAFAENPFKYSNAR